jgi:hypothetical protein
LTLTSQESFFYSSSEYLRPWKLVSLACGVALIIAGAHWSTLPDWDVPVSLIMASITYFTAPCSLRVVLEQRWKQCPIAMFWTLVSVDGSYAIYWHFKDPVALEQLRAANAAASLALYGMCAVVWLHRGPLKQLVGLAFQRVRAGRA